MESRTRKSVKNSSIALIMYGLNVFLQFFSRKIFIEYLGTDILGLNTTAMNLLQFLNLAELGIGAAIGFTLYTPLFNNDEKAINEILTLQRWYYHRIAFIVCLGSGILMLFFPLIFGKTNLPLWYAYASYSVILFNALLSYIFNYNQVILSADQKDYKIQYSFRLVILLKIAVQMFAVKYLQYPYIAWLVCEFIFSIISCISLRRTVNTTYPFLKESATSINELKNKHNILVKKIGQVLYHKIGGVALTQSSPLIIYAFANLSLVTIYGNYLIIVNALNSLLSAVFNSIGGGIGNLVASKDKVRILSVFKELFSIRFSVISTFCIGFYVLSPTIINFWLGEKYIMSTITVLLIIVNMFITMNRTTVDNYLAAYGLYGDIYAPIIETILNVGLSVLFGYFWGINGILFGVFISLFFVIFCWKPIYLSLKGFKIGIKFYITLLLKNLIACISGIGCVCIIAHKTYFIYVNSLHEIISYLIYVLLYFVICIIVQIILKTGISDLFKRIQIIFKR